MKTRIDIAYRDIKSYIKLNPDTFTDNPVENMKILSELIMDVNITKGELKDLDIEVEKGSIYLTYLLQENLGIDFNICKDYKIWVNRQGTRSMCKGNLFGERGNSYKCHGCLDNCTIKNRPK